jgi:hypothetical protein
MSDSEQALTTTGRTKGARRTIFFSIPKEPVLREIPTSELPRTLITSASENPDFQGQPNGSNGEKEKKRKEFRDNRGWFTPGNPGGPGNPRVKKTAIIRNAFSRATSAEDVDRIVDVVLKDAKAGDAAAAREALRRFRMNSTWIATASIAATACPRLPRPLPAAVR